VHRATAIAVFYAAILAALGCAAAGGPWTGVAILLAFVALTAHVVANSIERNPQHATL
jgi:hypothetical protein